jgi:hypothetical protein
VVPSRHGGFSFDSTCPAAAHCTRRPGDVAAQPFQPPAVVRFDPHGRVQTEAVDVGARRVPRRGLARHRGSRGQASGTNM